MDINNPLQLNVNNVFNDSEGDPVDVGTSSASDGTSNYAARRDHKHTLDITELETLLDSRYVNLTGDETIAGIKTFSSFPVTPSASPTADYEMANKKYVDDKAASQDQASEISISDSGGYYTGTDVEAALQEIGAGTTLDSRYLKQDATTAITNDWDIDGAGTLFVDKTNGNVGIGTTNPGTKLDIYGTDNKLRLSYDSSYNTNLYTGSNGKFYISNNEGGYYLYGGGVKNHLYVYDFSGTNTNYADLNANELRLENSSNQMNVYLNASGISYLNGGNVGIGTTVPSYKLDVVGTSATDAISSEMGMNFSIVSAPSSITGTVQAGSGLGIGTYYYRIIYYTATGHTEATLSSAITTTSGNQQVLLTIPVSSDHRVIGRKIYRTEVDGQSYNMGLLVDIANNTDTSYLDTKADADLTDVGMTAYYLDNTTSNQLTINGTTAGFVGTKSTKLGYSAGQNNTAGDNVFIGKNAGRNTAGGSRQVAIGVDAGRDNTSEDVISIGVASGNQASAGSSINIGAWAGYRNSGAGGIFIGSHAGYTGSYGITANYNTVIGYYAMENTSADFTGGYNVFLGGNTGLQSNGQLMSASNSIAIGYNTYTTKSNQVVLGNSSITETLLRGNVGIGTTVPAAKLDIVGSAVSTGNQDNLIINQDDINTGYYSSLAFYQSATNVGARITSGNSGSYYGYLAFETSNSTSADETTHERMRITEDGNVGIGTTTPSEKLDVNGNIFLDTDSDKVILGAGKDMSLYYNGTDGYIKTNEVAASDLHIVTGSAKTLELDNAVWEDQQVNMGSVATSGWFSGSEYCDIVEYRSGVAIEFQNDSSNNYLVRFNAQLSHEYKEGEDIEFHIHLSDNGTGTGDAVFKFTYQWANIEGTYGSSTTVSKTITIDGTDGKHQMEEIVATISGTGKTVSSILLCTLERDAGNTADTFSGSVYVTGIDFHIPVNTLGSRLATSK